MKSVKLNFMCGLPESQGAITAEDKANASICTNYSKPPTEPPTPAPTGNVTVPVAIQSSLAQHLFTILQTGTALVAKAEFLVDLAVPVDAKSISDKVVSTIQADLESSGSILKAPSADGVSPFANANASSIAGMIKLFSGVELFFCKGKEAIKFSCCLLFLT